MNRVVCFLFLIGFTLNLFSQKSIKGTVKNIKGEALSTNVFIQAKGSTTISGFTSTNEKGEYVLSFKAEADSVIISITSVSIGKHQKTVSVDQNIVNFSVEEKSIQLREVCVIPSKIQRVGDTLNYSVSSYMDQNDRVIGDVIKKLPGIDVSASGEILYRGKGINKFYIENLDLLQGRYGIATNNISAADVATVQVLENHQPIRALEKTTYSDDAAINIKLKDSAKGTLALTSLLGGGYKPWGWDAELVSLYFKKNMQNISAYKSNNIGKSLTSELKGHYDGERLILSPASLLSVQEPITPPIPLKRYFDNNSHAATVNHLSKIKDSLEIVTNIAYLYDYEKKEGFSLSEQYLSESNFLFIEEQMDSKIKSHNVEASVKLNSNKGNHYLNNYLNLKGSFNDLRGYTYTTANSGMDEYISQKLHSPSYGMDNTFNLIKNIGKKTFNIFWSTAYMHKPHNLTITPAYYWEDSPESLKQDILSKRFATNLRTSYKLRYGYFELDYTLWSRIDLQNLDTELRGYDDNNQELITANSFKNDLLYNNYQFGLSQVYSYNKGKLKANIGVPICYYILTTNDQILNNKDTHKKVIVNPHLRINYLLSYEFTLGVGGSYNKSFGDINSSYTGYIMHNYRNILRNTIDDLFESETGNTNFSLNYANAFDALFINLGGNYTYSWRNLLYGYNYDGIMSVKTTINQPTDSKNYGVNFSASKGFNFWSATLRVRGSYNNSQSELLIQDKILDSSYEGYGVGGSINILPVSFVNLQYSYSWNQGQNYVKEQSSSFPKIKNSTQGLQVNVFPIKKLTINANIEHQYNSATSDKNTVFADVGVKLKHKRIDYELEFNNIFNTKQYISTSYNSVNTYFYSYNLRSTNILLKLRFKLK